MSLAWPVCGAWWHGALMVVRDQAVCGPCHHERGPLDQAVCDQAVCGPCHQGPGCMRVPWIRLGGGGAL